MAESKLCTLVGFLFFAGLGCGIFWGSSTGEHVHQVVSQYKTDCSVDDYNEDQGICCAVDDTLCRETSGICPSTYPGCGDLPKVMGAGICGTPFTRSHGKAGYSRFCKECFYRCTSCYQLDVVARDVQDPKVTSVFPFSCTDESCIESLRTEFVRLFNTSLTFPCFSTGASLQLDKYSLAGTDIACVVLVSFLWFFGLLFMIGLLWDMYECLNEANLFTRGRFLFEEEKEKETQIEQTNIVVAK